MCRSSTGGCICIEQVSLASRWRSATQGDYSCGVRQFLTSQNETQCSGASGAVPMLGHRSLDDVHSQTGRLRGGTLLRCCHESDCQRILTHYNGLHNSCNLYKNIICQL